MGTSTFAVPSLRELYYSNFELKAVVTKPDRPAGRGKKLTPTPVKEEAAALGLTIYQPRNSEELLAVLERLNPQLIVNVAYGMILPSKIINFPPEGCVNLHPSLLPAYRGPNPIGRAVMNGEKVTGITVMFMSLSLDAGDIILQEEVEIDPGEDFGSLHDRLALQGSYLLHRALILISKGKHERTPQDEERATYAPSFTKEDEHMSWFNTAVDISNQIRALSPSPGAYTLYRGKRFKIFKAYPCKGNYNLEMPPGSILNLGEDFFDVVAGKGILRVTEIQLEGKKRISAEEFLRGYNLQVGERFETP